MKISRLLSIITILLNREKVTAAEFAQRFEVSVRTIIRDMQTIGEAGIPIVSYQGYEGGYGLVEGYKIDKHLMSSDEVSMTISVLKGMESAIGNASIQNLIDKFECLSQKSSDRIQVDLTPWGISDFEKQKLTAINQAVQHNQLIQIIYADRSGNASQRIIEPLLLGLKMSAWYLYGYCLERNDFRLFKVTRIKEIEPLDAEFTRRPFDSTNIFTDTSSSQPIVHLKLQFKSNSYSRMFDYFEESQMEFLEDGRVIVEVSYPEDEWVYGTILSFGSLVEVLEPLYIRDTIQERAREIIAVYQK